MESSELNCYASAGKLTDDRVTEIAAKRLWRPRKQGPKLTMSTDSPKRRIWVGFDLGGTKMMAVVFDDKLKTAR